MLNQIKNKINRELENLVRKSQKALKLAKVSPLLYKKISSYVLRDGKRIRPALIVIAYLGYAKKVPPGLYKSAAAMELLHDFMLIHDDIIDKSLFRRGLASMHTSFDAYLKNHKKAKFFGSDMAIVAGDILYALSFEAFLSIEVPHQRKLNALKRFIDAAFYTGCGEFIELENDLRDLDKVSIDKILQVYDYKTAFYTFAYPLTIGAALAGANKKEIDLLFKYGMNLGRAFQINDDILGLFGKAKEIGKSPLTDLQEGKKTILIWHAYKKASNKNKKLIKKILNAKKIGKSELETIKAIVIETKSLKYSQDKIVKLLSSAAKLLKDSKIKPRSKQFLLKSAGFNICG